MWDVNSGERIHTLLGHLEKVNDIAFSPDSTIIASVSGAFDWYQDFSVRLWNVQTGEELYILRGHRDQVQSVAFHPTKNLLVTTGLDGKVLMWDVDEILSSLNTVQQSSMTLFESDGWLGDVTLSPDGSYLSVIGNSDALIYEADTLEPLIELDRDSEQGTWLYDAEFSPDGNQLISVGHESVLIWDLSTSELQEVWMLEGLQSVNQDNFPYQIEFSPVDNLVAIAVHDQIQVFEYSGKHLLTTLTSHDRSMDDLAFSPDGKLLVSASLDGTTRLWGVPTSEE
ncbi:WD40 repeat domain-containing protein [Phototrophicus methaneseepsis]|uniref:WD40 repeat domain-containing protein n=1 Tax=Phototrophicus methaneseepsis TaxID=2710758 RepID=A0A7S8EAZ0_9CHLR|nr:WD40 repeat domain-containing protein [Phototrophicus methaneseepsis]QPC83635.1 WD40 repeat domain-containing protein [Phototrophicus methaneseepsis]